MTRYPPIQIVDHNDKPVGGASLAEIYERGLTHRVIYVIVEDSDGRILLQKRGPNVATYANCWDISAAGHVDEGETYEAAAKRELEEEIGLKGFELREIGKYHDDSLVDGLRLSRFRKTYKVIITTGTAINPDLTELSEIRWLTVSEAAKLLANHPGEVAIGLKQCLEEHYL